MLSFKTRVEASTGSIRLSIVASVTFAPQGAANDNEAHALNPDMEANRRPDRGADLDPIEEIISAVYGER